MAKQQMHALFGFGMFLCFSACLDFELARSPLTLHVSHATSAQWS